MPRTDVTLHSLLAATDIDVLPDTAIVIDRGDYVVVRSPTSPSYHWGNFLLWRDVAQVGDRERWEATFEREFGDQPRTTHLAFAMDRTDGERGAAEEFENAGYELDDAAALIATPEELVGHRRMNDDVEIRMLDPREGADPELWHAVADLQVANRDAAHSESDYRAFLANVTRDRRTRMVAGDGGWFAALTTDGAVAATCGIIVTDGRARYQAVDTGVEFRRRGIASRLVYDVGHAAVDRFGAEQLVIGADANYHALPLYESLGFVLRERGFAMSWWQTAPNAHLHPTRGHLARTPA